MSGGHYDYRYRFIEYLLNDIKLDYDAGDFDTLIDEEDRLTEPQKDILKIKIKNYIKNLSKLAKQSKDIEWLMSGDYSPLTIYEMWIGKGNE